MASALTNKATRQRNVRISMPSRAKAGEAVAVKTLISHPMHNGFRHDSQGQPIARDILTEFVCLYNSRLVLRAGLNTGIAANPFLSFSFLADVSGTVEFRWTDQHGAVTRAERQLQVNG